MEKKILAVIRTSTIRQEIESQKKDITDFCISKGFKEEEIVFVVGFGASARKRNEKYIKMLEEIKSTIEKYNLKNVAVWHLNRLGRTEENLTALKEYFEKKHIQVYVKNPSLVLFNEDGTLNNGTSMAWTIFAVMIKFETIELMEKLHRGREYKRSQKKFLGGRITYGYKVNESGYYEIDENESKVVHAIFDMYESGNCGASKIVQDLTEKSIYSRSGKKFSVGVINLILRNEDYITNEKYPAIISKEQFEKCREISAINDCAVSKERTIHLGSKILKCPDCGCSFSVNYGSSSNPNRNGMYLCNGAKQHKCNAEVRAINMQVFDYCLKYVSLNMYSKILVIRQRLNKEDIKNSIIDNQNRIENIKIQVAESDKKLVRFNRLYIDGYYNDLDFKQDYEKVLTEKNNLLSRIKELESKIEILNNQLKIASSNFAIQDWLNIRKDILQITDISQWKEIVNICISSAYLKKVSISGKSYTAIIIVLNDEKSTKELYLFNRRNLYSIIPVGEIDRSVRNFAWVKQMDYKGNSKPKEITLDITEEEYKEIIS